LSHTLSVAFPVQSVLSRHSPHVSGATQSGSLALSPSQKVSPAASTVQATVSHSFVVVLQDSVFAQLLASSAVHWTHSPMESLVHRRPAAQGSKRLQAFAGGAMHSRSRSESGKTPSMSQKVATAFAVCGVFAEERVGLGSAGDEEKGESY